MPTNPALRTPATITFTSADDLLRSAASDRLHVHDGAPIIGAMAAQFNGTPAVGDTFTVARQYQRHGRQP